MYLDPSTMVQCDKPPSRGLGGKRKEAPDGYKIGSLGRTEREGPRVTFDDHSTDGGERTGRIEGLDDEAARLRSELLEARATIASLMTHRDELARVVARDMVGSTEDPQT